MPNLRDFLPPPPWEGPLVPRGRQKPEYNLVLLKQIHDKWRELDFLQIELHFETMGARKWAALNALNAMGLELTKEDGYPAIGSFMEEKLETLHKALADLRREGEIIG